MNILSNSSIINIATSEITILLEEKIASLAQSTRNIAKESVIRYSLYERKIQPRIWRKKLRDSRLIALNRSSFCLIDNRGGIKDLALTSITPPPSVSATRVRTRDCSSPNATPYMYESIYVYTCVRMYLNAQVYSYAFVCFGCASMYVPSSEVSLDVRLPTNPLLYVRVSLLVPGSGNTPIKAVLHGRTVQNNLVNAKMVTAIACEPPVRI